MVLPLVLRGEESDELYMVEAKPIGDYFDSWRVTVRDGSIDASVIEGAARKKLGSPFSANFCHGC